MRAGIINTTRDLLITAIDLTRRLLRSPELPWPGFRRIEVSLAGSADVTNYLANAAISA